MGPPKYFGSHDVLFSTRMLAYVIMFVEWLITDSLSEYDGIENAFLLSHREFHQLSIVKMRFRLFHLCSLGVIRWCTAERVRKCVDDCTPIAHIAWSPTRNSGMCQLFDSGNDLSAFDAESNLPESHDKRRNHWMLVYSVKLAKIQCSMFMQMTEARCQTEISLRSNAQANILMFKSRNTKVFISTLTKIFMNLALRINSVYFSLKGAAAQATPGLSGPFQLNPLGATAVENTSVGFGLGLNASAGQKPFSFGLGMTTATSALTNTGIGIGPFSLTTSTTSPFGMSAFPSSSVTTANAPGSLFGSGLGATSSTGDNLFGKRVATKPSSLFLPKT